MYGRTLIQMSRQRNKAQVFEYLMQRPNVDTLMVISAHKISKYVTTKDDVESLPIPVPAYDDETVTKRKYVSEENIISKKLKIEEEENVEKPIELIENEDIVEKTRPPVTQPKLEISLEQIIWVYPKGNGFKN